jgi:hypothetical protein
MKAEEWVTAVSAMIAAVTGIWSVWWQTRGKHDRFSVGLGSVTPAIEQETILHVVNVSNHAISLKDWGFIEPSGQFDSLPLAYEAGSLQNEEITSRGSPTLVERNATFETGYIRTHNPIGAYAISVTQSRPRLCFYSDTPHWRRLRVRLRLLSRSNYLA